WKGSVGRPTVTDPVALLLFRAGSGAGGLLAGAAESDNLDGRVPDTPTVELVGRSQANPFHATFLAKITHTGGDVIAQCRDGVALADFLTVKVGCPLDRFSRHRCNLRNDLSHCRHAPAGFPETGVRRALIPCGAITPNEVGVVGVRPVH